MSNIAGTGADIDIYCIDCGYALQGLHEPRCPECGRGFDTSLPTSVCHKPLTVIERWLMRPPGIFTMLVTGVSGGWLLWMGTDPGFYYMAAPTLTFFWLIILGALYVTRLLVIGFVATRHRIDGTSLMLGGRRAAKLATGVLLVVIALLTQIPLKAGFLTAIARLNQEVAAHLAGRATSLANEPVGLYRVTSDFDPEDWHISEPGILVFYVDSVGEGAFVYSPTGYQGFHYNSGIRGRLWGDWYWLVDD